MEPRRIVSLCPSITETLVAIGGLQRLVAATRYCVRPRGLLWGLPRIGGTKNPDIGRILALAPDLVFANEEENRLEDVEALRDAGVEVDVTFPRKVGEVAGAIRQWGARLGNDSEAAELADRLQRKLDELESTPAPARFRYAYWIWKDPWMTLSDGTYVADLIRLAGGVNVFGSEPERYPRTTPAETLVRAPEVHFFPSEPYPFRKEKHEAMTATAFGHDAMRLFVEGDDFCWHGARTLEGLRRVRELRSMLTAARRRGPD